MGIDMKKLTTSKLELPAGCDIDSSKLESSLYFAVLRNAASAEFNTASLNVAIHTNAPVNKRGDAYLDASNNPIPGITIRKEIVDTMITATVSGAALTPLSKDPNVRLIGAYGTLPLIQPR